MSGTIEVGGAPGAAATGGAPGTGVEGTVATGGVDEAGVDAELGVADESIDGEGAAEGSVSGVREAAKVGRPPRWASRASKRLMSVWRSDNGPVVGTARRAGGGESSVGQLDVGTGRSTRSALDTSPPPTSEDSRPTSEDDRDEAVGTVAEDPASGDLAGETPQTRVSPARGSAEGVARPSRPDIRLGTALVGGATGVGATGGAWSWVGKAFALGHSGASALVGRSPPADREDDGSVKTGSAPGDTPSFARTSTAGTTAIVGRGFEDRSRSIASAGVSLPLVGASLPRRVSPRSPTGTLTRGSFVAPGDDPALNGPAPSACAEAARLCSTPTSLAPTALARAAPVAAVGSVRTADVTAPAPRRRLCGRPATEGKAGAGITLASTAAS